MDERLELLHSGLTITHRCTLKCKLCAAYSPYYNPPPHYTVQQLAQIIERYFSIVDFVEKFTLTGGEPFLHEDLPEIITELLKFKKQLGKIEIITNGTILPNNRLKRTLEEYGKESGYLTIMIDDYGKLSKKRYELENYFISKQISYRVRIYHGKDAYCGGWVDFNDFSKKTKNKLEMMEKFKKCGLGKIGFCFAIKNGEMHPCTFAHRIMELNLMPRNRSEYIDLYDGSSIQEQKNKMKKILKFNYLSACAYCNGLCEDSERFPPAEQL